MQPILVTTRANAKVLGIERETDFAFSVIWHAPVSKEPRQYAISVPKKHVHADILAKAGIFCIQFCTPELMRTALHNELAQKLFGQCETIDCPKLIHEPHLECETVHSLDLGDHYLVVGKVLMAKE